MTRVPRRESSEALKAEGPGCALFHRPAAIEMCVATSRAFEEALVVVIALIDVDDPQRHPALRAERSTIRHV